MSAKNQRIGSQLDGFRSLMTRKQRVCAPPKGMSVTRRGNIVCITNAGKRSWETGARQQVTHMILYGGGENNARLDSSLEDCWETNRYNRTRIIDIFLLY